MSCCMGLHGYVESPWPEKMQNGAQEAKSRSRDSCLRGTPWLLSTLQVYSIKLLKTKTGSCRHCIAGMYPTLIHKGDFNSRQGARFRLVSLGTGNTGSGSRPLSPLRHHLAGSLYVSVASPGPRTQTPGPLRGLGKASSRNRKPFRLPIRLPKHKL